MLGERKTNNKYIKETREEHFCKLRYKKSAALDRLPYALGVNRQDQSVSLQGWVVDMHGIKKKS